MARILVERQVITCLAVITPVSISSGRNPSRRICPDVYERIKDALRRPETGGILGADATGTVTEFYFDATGTTTENQYAPDVTTLNHVIAEWFRNGIEFVGFVHSHVKDAPKLSWADTDYAQTVKKACQMESVLMLLYLPETETFYEYVI